MMIEAKNPDLRELSADVGTISAGWLGDAAPGSATAAIRLSGTDTLPATNFIDFTATGSDPWMKHPGLTLEADGDATFDGELGANTVAANGVVLGDSGTFDNQVEITGTQMVHTGAIADYQFDMAATFTGYVEVQGSTADVTILDGGDTGGTEAAWIQIQIGGTTYYARLFTTK